MTTMGMAPAPGGGASRQVVSLRVAGHRLAIPVELVRDILGAQRLAIVPLAPPAIAGLLNLRGRVVTAIDLRRRLGVDAPPPGATAAAMNVVVEHRSELYSFLVDEIGDVLTLGTACFETDTRTLPVRWRSLATGIFRLEEASLIELDIDAVLDLDIAA